MYNVTNVNKRAAVNINNPGWFGLLITFSISLMKTDTYR